MKNEYCRSMKKIIFKDMNMCERWIKNLSFISKRRGPILRF